MSDDLKHTVTIDLALRQPLTDSLRQTVIEDLPELSEIADAGLQAAAVEAWAISLATSSFARISDLPGAAFPGMAVLKTGGQDVHIRGVTRLAREMAAQMRDLNQAVDIDDDILLAGALLHDLGKPFEMDPENVARWQADPSRDGMLPLRHTIYGAHIALAAGLPISIAHICACHSAEGENVVRSLECSIIHLADEAWWKTTAFAGLLEESTVRGLLKKFEPRPLKAQGDGK